MAVCSLAGLFLEGCDTASLPRPYSQTGDRKADAGKMKTVEREGSGGYKIQPGDLLLISFSGEPDFNQQVRVDWNGRINLPYFGGGNRSEIRAFGLNSSELAERITEYAKRNGDLLNPRAQVLVTEYSNQMFVVLGQVAQPGRYAFPRGVPPRMDLEDAIGTAGGYTRLARQSLILVKRGAQVYKVDLRKMTTRSGEPRFTVLPGDVITVTERLF